MRETTAIVAVMLAALGFITASHVRADAQEASAAPVAPALVTTRQTTFTIPFAIAAGSKVAFVDLYVSVDRGGKWTAHSREPAASGRFVFRAGGDGEFWFATRAIDATGDAGGAGSLTPELRVRVDTTSPVVDLQTRVGPAGEIIAVWSVSDADVLPSGLKLEYQGAGESRWTNVPLAADSIQSQDGKLAGENSWTAATAQRGISVRLIARDGAGNPAVMTRAVYLPRIASSPKPAFGPLPATPASGGKTPAPLDVDPFQRAGMTRPSAAAPQTWASDRPPVASATQDASDTASDTTGGVARPVAAPVAAAVTRRADESSANAAAPSTDSQSFAQPSASAPGGDAPRAAVGDVPYPGLPAGEHPRFTKNKRFQLEYDSDDVPADQIAAIELWGTSDNGKTWQQWGVDADKKSPFEIEVAEEGVFGFRIVVVHENGTAGHTPVAGDAADLWVGVDATAPQVKFAGVGFGKGANAGQLDIRWTASDAALTSRPITLSYAPSPEGPWVAIAAGLANTGQYFWKVEPSVPRKIYLRVESRDHAGHTATDTAPEPLELEGLAPRGRIRGLLE